MKDNEFKALIRLLDDDDPGVEAQIEQTLLSMGGSVIPRLEEAWEKEDNEWVQTRIEDIIQTIQNQQTETELLEWKSSPHTPLLEGWFLVSKYQFPDITYETYYNAINRLIHKAWLEHSPHMNIPEKITVINRMLFQRERYRVNRSKPLEPYNYYLNGLVESKKGGPISLAMLHMIVCQELKIPIKGIPIPGHFILVYKDERNEFFLDPINKGAFFTRKDLKKYLKEVNAVEDEKYYTPISHAEIIQELVKMLIICYRQAKPKDESKVLRWENLLQKLKYD